jgi:hypothetical protein
MAADESSGCVPSSTWANREDVTHFIHRNVALEVFHGLNKPISNALIFF